MAIIEQKYEGQLDGLIKDLRRLGLRVYFNINNALVSLGKKKKSFARTNHEKDKEINHLNHEINEGNHANYETTTYCQRFTYDDGSTQNLY